MKPPFARSEARERAFHVAGQKISYLRVLNYGLLVLLSLAFAHRAAAQNVNTTTTLSGLPPSNFQTLVATVRDSNNNPVTVGSVTFYDGSRALATLQLVRNASKGFTPGTATLKIFLGSGTHAVRAVYNGTAKTYRSSSSSTSPVGVSDGYRQSVSLGASGGPGNYTLTTTVSVSGAGLQNPAGTVNFLDETLLPGSVLGSSLLANTFVNPTGFLGPGSTANFNRPFARHIRTGDLNNDGKLDLAITTAQDNNGYIQIMLGNGDGTFTHKQTAQVRNTTDGLVMWDFNGDGVLDLAAANTFPCGNGRSPCGWISILMGAGDGTFQVNVEALASGSNPRGLAVGDLTGDGIPDLMVANTGGYLKECNFSNFNPNNPPQRYLDHTVSYYFANSDGSFQSQRTVTIVHPTTNQNQCQHVSQSPIIPFPGGYINLPDQNRSNPYSLAVGDFEGTGHLNVAVADKGYERVFMLRNDGNGNLSLLNPSLHFWTIGATPTSIETADFNKDGVADLVVVNAVSNTIDVFLGCNPRNSCGSPTSNLFPTKLQYRPGTSYQRGSNSNSINLTLPDINNDGNLDIVVQNENEFSISVFLGNGAGAFAGPLNFPAGNFPYGLAAGDFNSDGLADVVTSSSENPSKASVLLNSSGSLTATATLFGVNVFALGNPQHTVRAAYGITPSGSLTGDANYNPTYTNPVVLAGSLVPTTLVLTSDHPGGVVAGRESVTLTANLTPANLAGHVPGGTITFYDGGKSLGSATVSGATASLTTSYNTGQIGTHNLSALYSGDANFATSSGGLALAVNAYVPVGTGVALGFNPNGNGPCNPPNDIAPTCVFNGQTPVQISATVSTTPTALSGNTLTGSVTFYDGACNTGRNLGTGLLGPTNQSGPNVSASASVSASFATVGTHGLCAIYSGDINFAAGSGAQNLAVSQFVTPTVTTLAVTPSGATVAPGTVLTLAATVSDTNGNAVNPGLVIYYDAAREVGRAQLLAGGSANVKVRLPMGPHSLTASFQPRSGAVGTTHYGGSTSAAQAVTVRPTSGAPTTVSLVASQNSPYTLTGSVSASGVFPITGSLSFLDQTAGNFQLGSAAVGSSTVNLQLNPPSLTPVDPSPRGIAGDFNSDGLADIAISSAASNTVKINLGQANGSFNTSATLSVCNPTGMAVADFDSNGVPDLAIVSAGLPSPTCPVTPTNSSVAVFLGNGDGTLTFKATRSAVRQIQPYRQSIAVGDLNGDGIPDLVVAHPASSIDSVGRMLGNGDGTFGAEVTYVPNTSTSPIAEPTVLVVVDYNGDGYQDVVLADSASARLQAMLGDGSGALITNYVSPSVPRDVSTRIDNNNCCIGDLAALEAGDLTGDGLLDFIVLAPTDNKVAVFLTNSNRTFGGQTVFAASTFNATHGPNFQTTPSGIVLADVNGDTITDLLITNVNANPCQIAGACATGQVLTSSYFYDATNISLMLGTRSGSFQNLTVLPGSFLNVPTNSYNGFTYSNQYGYVSGLAGDFNGDGFVDVAALNHIPPGTTDIEVLLSGGTSLRSARASASVTNGTISAINITNAGTGYNESSPPECRIFSKTGAGATCICSTGVPNPPFTYIPQAIGVVGGGTVPGEVVGGFAHAYGVQFTYWNQAGETQGSRVSYDSGLSDPYIRLSAPGKIVVTAPPPVAGASGYYIYVQDASNGFFYVAKVKITGFGDGEVTALNPGQGSPPFGNQTSNGGVMGCTVTNGGSNYGTALLGPSLFVFNGNPTVTAGAQVAGITPNGGGPHNVIAHYPGDALYAAGDSAPFSLTANKIFVAAALGIAGASNAAGTTKTLTASISPSVAFNLNAGGTITFFDGGAQIGTATLVNGSASINTAPLAPGLHSFTAAYSGDANFLPTVAGASTTMLANTTSTTISATPTTSTAGQTVTVTATVSPSASGNVSAGGTVTFFDGGVQIGSPQPVSNGQAQLDISTLGGGPHSLSAAYSGDVYFNGSQTASPADITVNKIATTLTVAANPNAPTLGQALTLSAVLSPSTANSLTADGGMVFMDGTTTLGVVELTNGQWELVLPALSAGPHSFKASYKGNAYFEASDSTNTISLNFSKASTTLALSANPATVLAGQTTTLTAALDPSFAENLYATGMVTFKDGATTLGQVDLGAGPAEFSTAPLAEGTHNFSAVYQGDSNFFGSTGTLSLSVTLPPSLTPIVVNSTADTLNSSDGQCTLREAIKAANTDTASGAAAGECAAGSGADTITFSIPTTDPGYNAGTGVYTITLGNTLNVTSSATIQGPGASQLTISGNNAVTVFNVLVAGTVNLSGLTISNGTGMPFTFKATGGVINEGSGTVNITSCILTNNNENTGGGGGGAIGLISGGTVNVANSALNNNSAGNGGLGYGGAIAISGSGGLLTVSNSTFGNNSAGSGANGYGGAIASRGGTLIVSNSTFSNNSAARSGGAIYNEGAAVRINASTFSLNSTSFNSGTGGAINNSSGTVVVNNSTFSGNFASSDGGRGGAISNAGTFSLTNSTITNNSANVGGGLANSGTFSGGVFTPAPFNLGNSIVANNSAALGPDLVDTFNSLDYNLIRNTSFVTFTGATAHHITGQDPLLSALQDNGGPTFTRAPLIGSPVIDKGKNLAVDANNNPVFADQRGLTRPVNYANIPNAAGGDGSEIGAVESQPANTPLSLTINQSAGQTDPAGTSPINFTVVFSGPVAGFDSSDVQLSGTAGATNAVVTGGGATYNVAVSGMTQSGTVTATVLAAVAFDITGNTNSASTSDDNTVTWDPVPAVISILRASPDPAAPNASVNFTVTFNKPVTAVDASDFVLTTANISGASITGVSGSGAIYTVAVNVGALTGSPSGTVRLDLVDNDSIQDAHGSPLGGPGTGNGSFTGESFSVRLTSFVVNTTADTNDGSCEPLGAGTNCTLREAINAANQDGFPETISFNIPNADTGCAGGACTIVLTGNLPELSTSMTIEGPSASRLIVSGNNSAPVFGVTVGSPGVVNLSRLTISNGLGFDSNFNLGDFFFGGVINKGGGTLNVTNSTFSNNNTAGAGLRDGMSSFGGAVNNSNGTLNVTNSTFSHNSADFGGAIFNLGTLNVTNCTISDNTTAPFGFGGGGIYNESGTANVRNTIVANNTTGFLGPDLFGAFNSLGHNVIGNTDGTTGFGASGDLQNVNPLLGSLTNNGGPTLTHDIASNSPARDAGDNCVLNQSCATGNLGFNLNIDQRGTPRPAGATVDIGAFEFGAVAPIFTAYAEAAPGTCGGNTPCFNTVQGAIDAVAVGGTVNVLGGVFNESIDLNKNITVNVNGETTINALTISAGTLNGGNATLTLSSGNWTNNGGTFNPGTGTVRFTGSGQSIGGANPTTFNNLMIGFGGITLAANSEEGSASEIAPAVASVDAIVSGLLTLNDDLTITDPATLIMPLGATSDGDGDVIGNVKRTNGQAQLPSDVNLTFGNENNIINFAAGGAIPTDVTVNLVKTAPGGFQNAVQRTYTITQNNGSGFSATLRLRYLDGELGSNDENTMILWRLKSDGTAWQQQGASSRNTTENWLQKTGVTQFSPWIMANASPTAANGTVSGRVLDSNGAPVAGVVINLTGTQNRKTITNAKGDYYFDNVETTGFYTVTPARANYNFNPFNRSFSQMGNHVDAGFGAAFMGDAANPLDTPEFFVRQQYVDILGREPDEGGFNYWSNEILRCGSDTVCSDARRRDIAAAFFIEQEFQQSGSYIYNLYSGALGRKPRYAEYASDRRQVIGGPELETQKAAFAEAFVARPEFVQKYQTNTTADSFVDALLQTVQQTSGVDLASARTSLLGAYNSGGNMTQSRSLVLRSLADNAAFKQAEYNAAFVLTEYFGYLRRGAEPEGYEFWLNVLNNREAGNFRGMVCSFITSTEYQKRFSSVVTHSNAECAR